MIVDQINCIIREERLNDFRVFPWNNKDRLKTDEKFAFVLMYRNYKIFNEVKKE
jgi:hypothetical protein